MTCAQRATPDFVDFNVVPAWFGRLMAPLLVLVALPIAAVVFAASLGTMAAAALLRPRRQPAPPRREPPEGPVIEGTYEVVAESRGPASQTDPRR